jgi:integrative and conjugative element protein (TIGR02256 family)
MSWLVWVPERVLRTMQSDADRWYDLETGGALVGYWSDPAVAVVTAMIEGGPSSVRQRHSFTPDRQWEQMEVERHYFGSGRRETYIGDWHTHPDEVSAYPSWTDRRCLKNIIRSPEARVSHPIMILMCGAPGTWAAHVWIGHLNRKAYFFDQLQTSEAELVTY